ncbi:MAG: hypothetical protein ACI9K1_001057, partial [Arcticibacterium sp.]
VQAVSLEVMSSISEASELEMEEYVLVLKVEVA